MTEVTSHDERAATATAAAFAGARHRVVRPALADLDHIEVRGERENNLRDVSVDIPKRAITVFGVDSWGWRMYAESGSFDPDKKLADYSDADWERFLHGPEEKVEIRGLNLKWEGLVRRFERTFLSKDAETAQPHIRAAIERVATFAPCPECGGARLNRAVLGARIDGAFT